jgi:hypothetical protein
MRVLKVAAPFKSQSAFFYVTWKIYGGCQEASLKKIENFSFFLCLPKTSGDDKKEPRQSINVSSASRGIAVNEKSSLEEEYN